MKKPELHLKQEYIRDIDDEEDTSTIGLGIGARRPVKMWNKDKFIKLGKKLVGEGYNIAIFCSEGEKKLGEYVANRIGEKVKLYAGLDFLRLAFFLNKLRLFIGNDSGLRHIAAAVGIKTITVFGPEDIIEWHPYKQEDGHELVFHRLDCINCAEDKCPLKHHECMESITMEEVYEKVEQLIGCRFSQKQN